MVRLRKRFHNWWQHFRDHSFRVAWVVIIFGVTLFALHLAQGYSSNYLRNELQELRQEQARFTRAVHSLPAPAKADPRSNLPELQYVLDGTRQASVDIQNSGAHLEEGIPFYWLAVISPDHQFSDLREADRTLRNTPKKIRRRTENYTDTVTALGDFLAYEPATDMANFSPGSADTQKRMKRLRNGLDQTRSEIPESEAPGLTEDILVILKSTENARQTLKTEEDVDEFVSTINELQVRAVSVLDTHYHELTSQTEARLLEISHAL